MLERGHESHEEESVGSKESERSPCDVSPTGRLTAAVFFTLMSEQSSTERLHGST